MAQPLRVDTTSLRETGAQLRFVAEEFQQADVRSDDIGPALGHPGLAATVQDFAYAWNDRREQMLALIVELAEATTGIAEGFEYIDRELGAGLRGATS